MRSVTATGTGHSELGRILLDSWRRELYEGVLTSRSRTLFTLVDELATDQGRCGCPAHLSLGTVTGHAAAYRALRDGEIDTGRALRAACRIAARSGLPRVYAVDTTAWPRPNSPTSPDRQPQYTPGGPRGAAQIKTGWRYQHVVRLTLTPDSWVVPVLADRIASDDDLVEVTVDHIARVCATDGARPADPSLFLLDSGYPAARITHLLRERGIPADVLVRLATSQTMWTRPERRAAHPLGGRPRRHGFRLALRQPDLHPDAGVSGPLDIYGTVTVRAWHQVHPKLTRASRGFTNQSTLPIVEGSVLLARVQHLRPSRRAGDLALWYSGTRRDLLTLVMTYLARFDIEHYFRYLKTTAHAPDFHPPPTRHPDHLAPPALLRLPAPVLRPHPPDPPPAALGTRHHHDTHPRPDPPTGFTRSAQRLATTRPPETRPPRPRTPRRQTPQTPHPLPRHPQERHPQGQITALTHTTTNTPTPHHPAHRTVKTRDREGPTPEGLDLRGRPAQ
ncbi:hypothetical protein O7608_02035 [Solwaraspora sp. WMMA2056]|uniref:hypothetical protein n=1 Tax=Solwaraspora sp. WMMA2056 TaxID=3015161 RepID=UPI00259BB685|nr:hypothetical protein [Solwaraspora sp. WMMA2056]WJK41249.1 hypothetical protein O7608_02035 [Solwaraspora sp. WMMA2056]